MTGMFEELDYQKTLLGELVLRRRRSPSVPDDWVYEVKLGEEMLMSSTVNASERALARLALEAIGQRPCDVLVGGLGLGYTAATVLEYPNVRRLVLVELLAPVIAWHRRRLVPMADRLIDDPRCSIIEADFFQLVGPDSSSSRERYDVILLDIDHSPESWLHPRHAGFYGEAGLRALADCLAPGGVFGLWSASKPAAPFLDRVGRVFAAWQCQEVPFFNPHVNETDSNWVVIAKTSGPDAATDTAKT
jgi:spermidine synthase